MTAEEKIAKLQREITQLEQQKRSRDAAIERERAHYTKCAEVFTNKWVVLVDSTRWTDSYSATLEILHISGVGLEERALTYEESRLPVEERPEQSFQTMGTVSASYTLSFRNGSIANAPFETDKKEKVCIITPYAKMLSGKYYMGNKVLLRADMSPTPTDRVSVNSKEALMVTEEQVHEFMKAMYDIQVHNYDKLKELDIYKKVQSGYHKNRILNLPPQETPYNGNHERLLQRNADLIEWIKANPNAISNLENAKNRIAKYNYFGAKGQLPEMICYGHKDKGISVSVVGTDGGTDYEPYTTGYMLTEINIDWKHMLYPIRQQLNCTVQEASDTLSRLDANNVDSWKCVYDESGYDATYQYCKLGSGALAEVNETIASMLRNK